MIIKKLRILGTVLVLISYGVPLCAMDFMKRIFLRSKKVKTEIVCATTIKNPIYEDSRLAQTKQTTTLPSYQAIKVNRHRSNTIDDSAAPNARKVHFQKKLVNNALHKEAIRKQHKSIEDSPTLRRRNSEIAIPTLGRKATKQLAQLIAASEKDPTEISVLLSEKANPNDSDKKGDTILMRLMQQIVDASKKDPKALVTHFTVLKTIIESSQVPIEWDHKNQNDQTILDLVKQHATDTQELIWISAYLNHKAPDLTKDELVEGRDSLNEFCKMPKRKAAQKMLQRIQNADEEEKALKLKNYIAQPELLIVRLIVLRNEINQYSAKPKNMGNQEHIFNLSKEVLALEHLLKTNELYYEQCAMKPSDNLLLQLNSYFNQYLKPSDTAEEKELFSYNQWKILFKQNSPATT